MPYVSASDWDVFLEQHPEAHLLQTTAWGDLKSYFGWSVVRLVVEDSGAQVLFRRLPLGYSLAYIPKGPVGQVCDRLWSELDELCRQRHAVLLKIEPDIWQSAPESNGFKLSYGFKPGAYSIQPPRTILVDLEGEESHVLGRMKQKTRYNVRLALKRGVIVRSCGDLNEFYRLMEITGQRDKFGIHSLEYYQKTYQLFYPRGGCEVLLAEYDKNPLAALMVFARGKRAWYFYGASSNEHRDYMPTYILQWEAMRWARAQGCTQYDLWGVPDSDEETLEANFVGRNDGLWGVYRFKRGFGGRLVRAAGPWDRVYNPLLYRFYELWMRRTRSEE